MFLPLILKFSMTASEGRLIFSILEKIIFGISYQFSGIVEAL